MVLHGLVLEMQKLRAGFDQVGGKMEKAPGSPVFRATPLVCLLLLTLLYTLHFGSDQCNSWIHSIFEDMPKSILYVTFLTHPLTDLIWLVGNDREPTDKKSGQQSQHPRKGWPRHWWSRAPELSLEKASERFSSSSSSKFSLFKISESMILYNHNLSPILDWMQDHSHN